MGWLWTTPIVFKLFVLFPLGPLDSKTGVVLTYLGLPSVVGFFWALGTSSVQLGDEQHMVFFGLSISMYSFVLQQLISVCIFIGTQQSEIARGGDSGVLGLLAALFLRFLFGLQSCPQFPFFPYGKVGIAPWLIPSSVGGVMFFFDGFYKETLSLGLDLVFYFFLGLILPTVSHREMNLDWRSPLSLEPGRRGESPA